MNKPKTYLGAHLSTAGGLLKTLERAKVIGATSIQIFASNPRGWSGKSIALKAASSFVKHKADYQVGPLVIHAIYLVNLASPDAVIRNKSMAALKRDLISAGRLGVNHIVLHPGSDKGEAHGLAYLIECLKKLRPFIPARCKILLEGMAGTRNSLGDLVTLKKVLSSVGKKHFGICLDTAHLFATGYDIRKEQGLLRLQEDIKRTVGLKSIGCIHLNDSKQQCGSKRDHHENLGVGKIGKQGLINFLKVFGDDNRPVIMETPGFDDEGPDLQNMKRLKKYYQIANKK